VFAENGGQTLLEFLVRLGFALGKGFGLSATFASPSVLGILAQPSRYRFQDFQNPKWQPFPRQGVLHFGLLATKVAPNKALTRFASTRFFARKICSC
jgi:hypothetical protein